MQARQRATTAAPVDNRTYNVMQALVSKLEAIEAYRKYAQDDGGQIFEELIEDEVQQAGRLVNELKDCLAAH